MHRFRAVLGFHVQRSRSGLAGQESHTRSPALAKGIYDALDKDQNSQFCWNDVDLLTLESATKMAQFLKEKQVIVESGLGDFNRSFKKINELKLEMDDPRFLETLWEELKDQYGDKVGNIFDGPALQEMREEYEQRRRAN